MSIQKTLEISNVDGVTIVNFLERKILEDETIRIISEQLFFLVDTLGVKVVLIDFGSLRYLSSAMIGKLITLRRKIYNKNGVLMFSNMCREVYDIFKIARLEDYFEIFANKNEALSILRKS